MIDPSIEHLTYQTVAFKAALSAGIGLLVGLEREWARKEIGVRTFAIACLLGMLTSLVAPEFVIVGLISVLILVVFLNVHSLLQDRSLELTTSLCLVVVVFLGALVGLEHYFTAATAAIIIMLLLSWKLELERFAGALRPEEIRSAVLLGLLSVVIYPLLPNRFVDPWHLINPREFWVIVVVIAGIGFVNYVLLRLYGNRGLFYAAVLGGLVNATAAAVELAAAFGRDHRDTGRAASVLMVTNVAMVIRNTALLAIFAPRSLTVSALPLALMAASAAVIAWLLSGTQTEKAAPLRMSSPISFVRVGKFSLLFLAIAVVGTLAQRAYGNLGFLLISALGGLVSSASTTASAASLVMDGKLTPLVAGVATVLTSAISALVRLPLVHQQTRSRQLTWKLGVGTVAMIAFGLAGSFGMWWFRP